MAKQFSLSLSLILARALSHEPQFWFHDIICQSCKDLWFVVSMKSRNPCNFHVPVPGSWINISFITLESRVLKAKKHLWPFLVLLWKTWLLALTISPYITTNSCCFLSGNLMRVSYQITKILMAKITQKFKCWYNI